MDLKKIALSPCEGLRLIHDHERQELLDALLEHVLVQRRRSLAQCADEYVQVLQRLAGDPAIFLDTPEVVSKALRVRQGRDGQFGFLQQTSIPGTGGR
jgi:hypothetical protein